MKDGFPIPEYDESVRKTYKGGFTYLTPEYKEKDLGEGLVLDVNSLYPSVMRNMLLPYGEPLYFTGEYEYDSMRPLYVQELECAFELKEGYIPTLQMKNGFKWGFAPTEYLTSSADHEGNLQIVTLWLTNVDLDLFKEHYNIYNEIYHCGFKFKATTGLFTEYIDKWTKVKTEATLSGNKAMRTLAKVMLNALYGKFSLSPKVASKFPYYEDGKVKYQVPRDPETKKVIFEDRDPIYIPVGTFITSWARYKTITSAQKVKDIFVYADTDSLHLRIDLPESLRKMSNKELENLTTADLQKHGLPLPDDFEVDPVKLGAWKVESRFNRARFIRQKCYMEDWNKPKQWNGVKYSKSFIKEYCETLGLDFDKEIKVFENYYNKDDLKITCAGMPKSCYPFVTWENFREGATYKGKLLPEHVKGGIVLKEIDFTIKRC